MKAVKFINLTPHAVRIQKGDVAFEIARSDSMAARITTKAVEVDRIMAGIPDDPRVATVPLMLSIRQRTRGLPDPSPGIGYIVSKIVADHYPDRDDLYYPVKQIRAPDGAIVACQGLIKATMAASQITARVAKQHKTERGETICYTDR